MEKNVCPILLSRPGKVRKNWREQVISVCRPNVISNSCIKQSNTIRHVWFVGHLWCLKCGCVLVPLIAIEIDGWALS